MTGSGRGMSPGDHQVSVPGEVFHSAFAQALQGSSDATVARATSCNGTSSVAAAGTVSGPSPAKEPAAGGADRSKEGADEVERVFGAEAPTARRLLRLRSDVDLVDVLPQRRDVSALRAMAKLLLNRRDLNADDLYTRNLDGKRVLHSSVRDVASVDLLEARRDLTPADLARMRSALARALRDESRAEVVHSRVLGLLRLRSDLGPQDMIGLVGAMGRAVRRTSAEGGMSALSCTVLADMMENTVRLLSLRGDFSAASVQQVCESVAASSGASSPALLSRGLALALEMLATSGTWRPESAVAGAGFVPSLRAGDAKSSPWRPSRLPAVRTA